ncbi:NAD(P)/FAD-dependent oxidoreductase [Bradyrhizobium japonicum]|uniref:NAD(P)/FAD-dependent oxidoreductase n=1 Tax=Bradyrhizobium japonicum TaxID=375 RepID=UPI002714EFC1|nr:FAD-dependent monooxygenase [Bradyrhizobium japonicum]WLB23537.1 FAD-dependent monooxygenase [Bradyrhizobium japonicum]
MLRTDCLVVGAGPAGLTTARLLALRGRTVIVADSGVTPTTRLELLAPASLATVAAVGLEHLLDDPAIARACLGIRRTHRSGASDYEDFLRHPCRVGYVVDRARFDERLRDEAVAVGVTFCGLRAIGVTPDRGVICRASDSARTKLVLAEIVVDATGRAAAIARRRGARVAARDRMVAELVEDAADGAPAGPASWLDYSSDGPTWSVQTWRIRRSGTPAGDALLSVDASACLLSEAAGEGWIAVGDAAMAFDPIASQGLFNALSSALVATGALLSADRLSPTSARLYSDAVATTFLHCEAGRSSVYGAMPPAPQSRADPAKTIAQ